MVISARQLLPDCRYPGVSIDQGPNSSLESAQISQLAGGRVTKLFPPDSRLDYRTNNIHCSYSLDIIAVVSP